MTTFSPNRNKIRSTSRLFYLPGEELYDLAIICSNCGYPEGEHFGQDKCPNGPQSSTIPYKPVFFIYELNRRIKIL